MTSLPSSVQDVTPEWLEQVLLSSGALAGSDRITSLGHEPLGPGTGLLSELHRVSYRSAESGDGSVVVKLSADNELRTTVDQLGLYQREVDFYRHLGYAPDAAVPLGKRLIPDGLPG